MSRIFKYFTFYIFIFIGCNCFGNVVCDDCQFQDRNFETLNINSPWSIRNNSNGYLVISLCKPLLNSSCSGNVSVCYYDELRGNVINFGNSSSAVSNNKNFGSISLEFEGDKCSSTENFKTTIYFECGKSLGYPKFVSSSNPCKVILKWQTTALCKEGTELSQIKSTKCYGYNSKHLFINLNTLDDVYGVGMGDDDDDQDDDDDIFSRFKDGVVNVAVCRDMKSDESCPGKGACLVLRNGTSLSLGRISKPLDVAADDTLSLTYRDDATNIPGCKEVTTSISFFCPQRGIGSVPRLLTSSRCSVDIRWETEAACPTQETTSSSSCSLASNKHFVDFSSLSSDVPHKVIVEDKSDETVEYRLHVCSDKLIECGSHMASACQINLNNSNSKSIGNFSQQTFRYSDGTLQMELEGGDPCGTGFFRNTIIDFHCDRTSANDSISFAYEDMCTYFFNWNTPLACLTPSISCSLKEGNMTYDLSSLIKIDSEENWRTGDNSTILNLCRSLNPSDPLAKNCGSGAICRKAGDKYVNHGSRMEALTFNTEKKAVQLEYKDGDVCGTNKHASASILIFCDPNVITSQPYVVGNSSDGCHISLEWHLSSACGVGHMTGQNCLVKDPMTGIQFDLSPLKLSGVNGRKWYKVENDYDYFINVCGPLVDTPCTQSDVGVCQVSRKNTGQVHSTGRWNDELHYVNGFLRLTYKDGDNYNSNPPLPRHTDIEFVCNSGAGLGQPLFVMETNRTYKFLWHTALACLNNFDKCSSFLSNGQNFDLSFLVQQGSRKNWQMKTSLGERSSRLFFNLCRGLLADPEIKTCNPLHSACLTYPDSNETISLGRYINQPEVKSDAIVITYGQGDQCKENSTLKYSLEVHLHCTKTEETSDPSSVDTSIPCIFKIHWYTKASCVTAGHHNEHKFDDDSCVLKLDQSGQTFNITRLKDRAFDITVASVSYSISLCGESSKCGAGKAACTTDGEKVFVSREGRKLSINAAGSPELQLVSDKMKILIQFKCNPNSSLANESLDFVEARSGWSVFSFSTQTACLGTTVNCQASDKDGNEYDLEPLSKIAGSWTALNLLGDSCEFNLCRSLPLGSAREPCTSSGSCLKRLKGNDLMNGGQVKDTLEATAVGLLRIRYSDGGPCGTSLMKRSTLILLKCSSIAHDPILLNDVDDCETLIQWRTPFACPKQHFSHVIGENCQVRHPSYANQLFDLAPLKAGTDFEIDFFDVGKYLIRVCSEVWEDAGCKDLKAGACLVDSGGKRFNMGTFSDKLEYTNGKLSLNYSSSLDADKPKNFEQCRNVSTYIEFKCEHDNLGISSGPIYVSGSCHKRFQWVTSLACFKYKEVSCKIDIGQSVIVDLSHLMLHNSNYEVGDDDDGRKFVINICSTLVHTEGNSCPPNSAACMIDTKTGSSTNIGTIPDDDGKKILSMEGDKLKLVYSTENGNATTIIYFSCDYQAPETSTPSYVLTENGNTFIFTWKTRLMCTNKDDKQANNCSVTDPHSGHRYDLSPLRAGNPHEVDAFGQRFKVFVCSCEPIGSCLPNQGPWLLNYNRGTIFLKYRGGQDCGDQQTSTTMVGFECPANGEEEGLRFVMKNEHCLHFFQWKTRLACKNELKCLVQGSRHNLSPLVIHNGKYSAETSNAGNEVKQAFVNVCAQVTGVEGCKSDAAVCIKLQDGRILSGGGLGDEPKYDVVTKEISLTYTTGDKCQNDTWSTKIVFTCSKISDLHPMLMSIDKSLCLVTFQWKTDLVCFSSSSSPQSFNNCELKFDDIDHDFTDLSEYLATQRINSSKGSFQINLCSNSGKCASDVVCLLDGSSDVRVKGYGDKNKLNIIWEGNNVKFYYPGKSDQAVLIFICDQENSDPVPKIIFESDSSVGINIKTRLTCPSANTENTNAKLPGKPAENDSGSHGSYTPIVITVVVVLCALFVIVGLLIHRKRRGQRGYEPVDAIRYSRDYDEELQAPLFSSQDDNEATGLQNYTSDDDLML